MHYYLEWTLVEVVVAHVKAPLSIYDPPEPEHVYYVALPEEHNDFYPFVRTARLAVQSVINRTQVHISAAQDLYKQTKVKAEDFFDGIPHEERHALGLAVMTVAGMTGSLTYLHRPWFRRLVVIPSLATGSAILCYPQTCKHIIKTGLFHSGSSLNLDSAIENPLKQLPSTQDVGILLKERATWLQSILSSSEEVSTDKEAEQNRNYVASSDPDVIAAVNSLEKPQETDQTSNHSTEVPITAADVSSGLTTKSNEENVFVVGPNSTSEVLEDNVQKDFGQSVPEDTDTYTSRRTD